ncbi:MAG TPA: hypothetical protein VMV46_07930 [Thermoanaerobaculia bacterium]|nr:hypothetical protein [Thermoanaerobaculia bacterium]
MSGTTMTVLKGFLWLLAAFDVLYGLFALAAPVRAAGQVGLELATVGAHGEIRAIYGGMMVAMGVVTAGALVLGRHDWLVALGIRPKRSSAASEEWGGGGGWLAFAGCRVALVVGDPGAFLATPGRID